MREVVNAALYMARTGCQWRMLPKDFPPKSTVRECFYAGRADGTLNRINREPLLAAREAGGREASRSAGVIDSQSVKTMESGGPRWFDAAKLIKGRKQGLQGHHRQRRRLAHDRQHPTPYAKDRKTLKSKNLFPAGLL